MQRFSGVAQCEVGRRIVPGRVMSEGLHGGGDYHAQAEFN